MKKLVIFLAVVVVALSAFLVWLFERDADGVPILSYHRVNDIDSDSFTLTVEQFDAQMKYLVDDGFTVITPDELLNAWEGKGKLPKKPVVITFDEGSVDNYKNVFPILQKYNLKATIFVITDNVNLYPNYLTWDQAREMQNSGLVDIESHTLSNKSFKHIYSRDKLWDQIYGSKQAIEWYLKKSAKFIAYPEGKYTVEAEELCKEVGYRAGFTVDYGLARKDPKNYVLDRIPIYGANSHTLFRFKMRLKGAPIVAPLMRFKESLIKDGNAEIADLIPIP
ncbi:MAG: polysaccharide deacetylase family protein [Selenomonadaceae bacterium]|nr:polysaccharide deacetylase family protein [Selenomonadaceae bacterium]